MSGGRVGVGARQNPPPAPTARYAPGPPSHVSSDGHLFQILFDPTVKIVARQLTPVRLIHFFNKISSRTNFTVTLNISSFFIGQNKRAHRILEVDCAESATERALSLISRTPHNFGGKEEKETE